MEEPSSIGTPPPPPPSSSSSTLDASIFGVALVGFDHALGPNVEFLYPSRLEESIELKESLPFLALPDGAHAREEDYTYFHLHLPNISSTSSNETIFGISCNRQIMANELLNKSKDITRSTVQKSIVVLASKPIFGPLRDKLGVITRSFFAQRDFKDKSILIDLYQSFQRLSQSQEDKYKDDNKSSSRRRRSILGDRQDSIEEEGIYMGTFLRELVHKFRFKTLMLLKLLMLQRRVLFYSTTTTVEQLCTFQYSLVALIPALLTCLQDSASPELSNRLRNLRKPCSLKTSDKSSLIRYLGLPLELFSESSFFQPYLPLQQIELLNRSKSYLVGTTNSIIQQQRDCNIDVVVNLDTTSLTILNQSLTPLINLTPQDRKWMDELVTTVDQSWNNQDPTRPQGLGWLGSEDFLRGKFEEYVCSLLACVKFGDFLKSGKTGSLRPDMLLSAPELESYNPTSFNESFIKAFKQTRAFEIWDKRTDEVIFDLVEPKHPMEGKTNPFEDVGIRLVSGLHDSLPENFNNLVGERLNPTKEAIQRGFVSGSEGIWGAVKWAREEAGKRQRELQGADLSTATSTGGGGGGGGDLAEVAQKGAASVAAGLGGLWGKARASTLFTSIPSPNPNRLSTTPNELSSTMDQEQQPRPPSPTPSIVSTTSSNKSSSLVTVQAQLQQQQQIFLTTPPTNSSSTFLSTSPNQSPNSISSRGGGGGGLRPLSTAVAATPAASSSSSTSSPSIGNGGGGGGFSSFFGGIRRSFIEPTPSLSPSNPTLNPQIQSTTTSNHTGTRGLTLPTSLTSSFSNWNRSSSSISPSQSPSINPSRPSPSISPTTTTGDNDDQVEAGSVVEVKDFDQETGEEIVVLRVRDLDQERKDEESKKRELEETRRKLEGA